MIPVVVAIEERCDAIALTKKLKLADARMRIVRPEEIANRRQVVEIHRRTFSILIRQPNPSRHCLDNKRCAKCVAHVRSFVLPEVVESKMLRERDIFRGHIAHLNRMFP